MDRTDPNDERGNPDTDRPNVYENISTVECVVVIALAFPFYLFFDHQGQPFRGLVAGMGFGIVLAIAWILRPLRSHRAFWPSLSLVALAHVALVYFLPYTGDFRFGFALFPIFFLDAYLWARVVIFACGVRLKD
jgi:hypothetical protein